MPLEPGESFPSIRRRVGTAYQLPENLLKNSNKDELISDLELQIQLHANLAEAALGLAKETNSSKVTIKICKFPSFLLFDFRLYGENIAAITNNIKNNV